MKAEKIIPPQGDELSINSGQALRRRAEDVFREKAAGMEENMEALSPDEARQTLHELRVHQIELEMQNEELRRTQGELVASRLRYFDLYDLAPVGYFTLSEAGLILEVNLTAATLLGVARSALIKQRLTSLILPEDQDIYYGQRKLLFETGAPQVCELRLVKKDAPPFWVRIDATAAQDADGAPVVCRATMIDITERKRAEEALKASSDEVKTMSQQLWQAARLTTMGELASSIAHELNNPLTTVSLRIESLTAQTSQDDPRQRELEIIGQEVERMGNLVSNLLQFSRRSQKHVSTVDVCEEIEKTFELIEYHLRKNNIQVIREFAPEVPKILADRQQLRQLFLNLFTNAGDAMPQGGTLTIRIAALTKEKKIFIEIADMGTGIPPEILPKVMEPFYTTKSEGKGTGLGLAICRRIAQEHQGTFDIVSEGIPGKGTRVCITLPFSNGSNAKSFKGE
jgi:PAS domain S-box-containing protein